ncbi:MAG TPA: hypothetical protein VJC06_01315, partial [Candidatus Paceibacterota bacterium]
FFAYYFLYCIGGKIHPPQIHVFFVPFIHPIIISTPMSSVGVEIKSGRNYRAALASMPTFIYA